MYPRPRSLLERLAGLIFPRMPDFFDLLNRQCLLMVEGMEALAGFLERGEEADGLRVRELEHRADDLKFANIELLHRSFATPIDREDLYRAMVAVDEVLNYAKTTVREIQILELAPDPAMAAMGGLLLEGARALQRGFAALPLDHALAQEEALAARKAERRIEKEYRLALAAMFADQRQRIDRLGDGGAGCREGFDLLLAVLKKRELYRHLSNAADHLAQAGEVLHDIVVKTS